MAVVISWVILCVLIGFICQRVLRFLGYEMQAKYFAIAAVAGLGIGAIDVGRRGDTTPPQPVAPASTPSPPANANRDSQLSYAACEAAIKAVKTKLKSPSRAEFPGCVFGANQYEVRINSDRSRVGVSGHVDSQNSYGAMLRRKFVVFLDMSGSEDSPQFTPYKVVVE